MQGGTVQSFDLRGSMGFVWLLTAALGQVACGGDASESEDGREAAAVNEIRVAPEPVATIGVVGGEPEYELSDVRAAVRLTDGRTVVANRGTSELRYYDERGRHLRTVGRVGEGPGEFDDLRYAAAIRGDTIVAWDYGHRRVSLFDKSGDVVHDVSVDLSSRSIGLFGASGPASPAEVVAHHDGTLLVRPQAPVWLVRGSVASDGVYRAEYPLYVMDRDGAVADSLGPFETEEYFVREGRLQPMLVGRRFYMAAGSERVYTGSGVSSSFEVTGGGGTVDTVAIPKRRGILTDSYWQRLIDRVVVSVFAGQEVMREFYSAMPRPDSLPAYSRLLADAEDRVWVGQYVEPDEGGNSEHREWWVFDPSGQLLGSVTMPEGLAVTHIGMGFVTGVMTDGLGVERVQIYRLLDFP